MQIVMIIHFFQATNNRFLRQANKRELTRWRRSHLNRGRLFAKAERVGGDHLELVEREGSQRGAHLELGIGRIDRLVLFAVICVVFDVVAVVVVIVVVVVLLLLIVTFGELRRITGCRHVQVVRVVARSRSHRSILDHVVEDVGEAALLPLDLDRVVIDGGHIQIIWHVRFGCSVEFELNSIKLKY